jgi:serine/threonine protein kinase
VRTYLGQIADALAFLHKRNICHRDVKDENIVLGEGGRCWLIDFGSSGIVRKGGWDTFSGTLDYAGPEILRGERYSGPPQDVWAFGILAFVLLTGECPFSTPAEAAVGLEPMSKALMALNQRCAEGHEEDGREDDNGGRLIDARSLVMSCLQIDVLKRPTFAQIIKSRYLAGGEKEWGDVEDLTSPITSPISPTKSNESSG